MPPVMASARHGKKAKRRTAKDSFLSFTMSSPRPARVRMTVSASFLNNKRALSLNILYASDFEFLVTKSILMSLSSSSKVPNLKLVKMLDFLFLSKFYFRETPHLLNLNSIIVIIGNKIDSDVTFFKPEGSELKAGKNVGFSFLIKILLS